jgi:hypothetical protein
MSYPGIIPITQQSFLNGATSPRTDAIQQQTNMNQKQNLINQAGQGRRIRRRKYRGGTSNNNEVPVPQFDMLYTSTGAPGTNPNSQIAIAAKNGMQSNANSVYDNNATKMGGRRKNRKGGNPDWLWGCYSGGKTKRRGNRKSRKYRKKTRRYKRQ